MAGDDGDDWINLYKRAISATPTKIRYLVATIPFIIQLYIGYLFSQNIQIFVKNPEITAGIMASYIVLVIFAVLYEVRSVSDDEESDGPSVDEADSSVDSAQLDLDDVSVQVLVRELQRLHEETATSEEIEEVQQRLDKLEDAISEREEGVVSTSADKGNTQTESRQSNESTDSDRQKRGHSDSSKAQEGGDSRWSRKKESHEREYEY
jgi:hypothetical protein